MEQLRTPEKAVRIPTADSFEDIDQARLYVEELLLRTVSVDEGMTWWDSAAVSLDNHTAQSVWYQDPSKVIRWAHTYVSKVHRSVRTK